MFIIFTPTNCPGEKNMLESNYDTRIFCICFLHMFGVSQPIVPNPFVKPSNFSPWSPRRERVIWSSWTWLKVRGRLLGWLSVVYWKRMEIKWLLSWNIFAKMMNILNLDGLSRHSGWWPLKDLFVIFTSKNWGDDEIWRAYFSDGLKQPTRYMLDTSDSDEYLS